MFINYSSKEVTAKIVYYGTGLSGKTTNLQYIYSVTNPQARGELVSVETDIERTLFFDLLPINVGLIKGYFTKFQLYTVPGQIFYDSTRKMVLKGADGVVFVADSQEAMEESNIESLENLRINLAEQGDELSSVPLVFQYNKRDLKNIMSIEKMNRILNPENYPYFEAVSTEGRGVVETLREISALTLDEIKREIDFLDTKSGVSPEISFDINTEKEIISKDDIPVKRIKTDDDEKHDIIQDVSLREVEEDIIVLEDELEVIPQEEERKQGAEDKKSYDLLDSLQGDSSRLTIIKKIQSAESFIIDIKDSDSNILKTIDIELTKGVEKINLILDVEK